MRFTYTALGKSLIERQSEEDVWRRRYETLLISCISVVLFLIAVIIMRYISGKSVSSDLLGRNLILGVTVSGIIILFRSNTARFLTTEKYPYSTCSFEAAELSEYYLRVDEHSISFTQAEDLYGIIFNDDITVKFDDIAYSEYPVHKQNASSRKPYLRLVMKKGRRIRSALPKKNRKNLVLDLRAYRAEELLSFKDVRSKIKLIQ